MQESVACIQIVTVCLEVAGVGVGFVVCSGAVELVDPDELLVTEIDALLLTGAGPATVADDVVLVIIGFPAGTAPGFAPFVAVGVVPSTASEVVTPVVAGIANVGLSEEDPSAPHAATRATTAIITRVDMIFFPQCQLPWFNREHFFISNELSLLIIRLIARYR